MNFENIITKDFYGWKRGEYIFILSIFTFVVINALLVGDNVIAVISAYCGILYTFMAGKGRVSCFVFGLMGSALYGYLSLINHLWGNLALYMCYYIPMQILGLFTWKKNLNKQSNEIIKSKLSSKEMLITFGTTALITLIVIYILYRLGDKSPAIDGITTVFSILGMYLTVRRIIEQWTVWLIVNGLSTIMWLIIALQGVKVWATVIMWFTYFLLAIYFYREWRKELKNNI